MPFGCVTVILGTTKIKRKGDAMKKRTVLFFFALLLSAFITGCGCGGGDNPPVLMSLEVSPANPSIALGTAQQFKATGVFSDSTSQDMTESVTWSLSDGEIASISNDAGSRGLAHSLSVGTTEVKAASGSVSGSTSLTVTAATLVSIDVTPKNPTLATGTSQQFKATGTFTDDSTQDITSSVTWSSSDTSVATISNEAGSRGLATSLSGGTTSIKATFGNIAGQTTMTVTSVTLVAIKVTPVNPIAHFNATIQFKATGIYSDNSSSDITTVVTWSSSDTSIATISNAPGTKGLATTDTKFGFTTITATLGTISGSSVLMDP
jgi:hypothetical protein